MAISAHFVLKVSERWVNLLPISSSFLGVIILGTVSAFPELVTSVISLRKGKKNVSAGVLIGSNITNPLLGIGIGALISTYTVPVVIYEFDLPVKIVTAGLLLIFFRTSEVLTRLESAIVLLSFIAYIVLRPLLYAVDTF
jgi:cation:H+ antiporter